MAKKGKRKVFKDFYETSGRSFQTNCFKWLSFLFPEIRDAVDLGEVDREGVDLYVLKRDLISYLKVFQCKGFEKTFADKQFKQCKKSIDVFIKSGSITEEYFLIINHELNSFFFAELTNELKRIEKAKKAKKTYLLTARHFLKYYSKEFQRLVMENIKISNKKFYDSYTSKMGNRFYLEAVPFLFNEEKNKSPLKFIWERCAINVGNKKESVGHKEEGKFFFLISEFGFGKTSLLLNFFEKSLKAEYIPIYVPVAVLGSQAFSNTSSLTKEIFKIIFEYDFDDRKHILNFAAEVMTSLFKNNPKIILLFDGLDEHLYLFKLQGLKDLFNSTIDFKSPLVFGFRKSYYDERSYDFQLALPKSRNIQDRVFLIEWEDKEIETYIELYLSVNGKELTDPSKNRLKDFVKLIQDNSYNVYYGDIPKRPLFLEMIIGDIVTGNMEKRTLSELYLNYFLEKFERDLQGQFDRFTPQRELPDFSVDFLKNVLILIHESAARNCIKNENFSFGEEAILENSIHEKEIRVWLSEFGLSHDIGKFISISVLNAISKRGNMNMWLRFAHKSFMEFFIARIVCKELLHSYKDDQDRIDFLIRFSYPETVLKFMKSILHDKIQKEGLTEVKKILEQKVLIANHRQNTTFDFLIKEFALGKEERF